MSELTDILRKVQGLLAQADHPNTGPAEADAFRAKAEALMFKYRIDEAMLSTEDRVKQAIVVGWTRIVACESDNHFRGSYDTMMRNVIRHLDIRGMQAWEMNDATGKTEIVYHLCGYESDLLFAEALFLSVRLAFSAKLEPKYDATLSEQVNAYLMRSAGMEGWRIAEAIYGKDAPKSARPKVRKMFEAEATKRGEDPKPLLGRGSNMELFRDSYAMGFVGTIGDRLRTMRESRGAAEIGMVLASRKETIDEAFYARYEYMRPKTAAEWDQMSSTFKPCDKCAKSKTGHCRDHPKGRKRRTRYANSTAMNRGRDAARTVDLGITGRNLK